MKKYILLVVSAVALAFTSCSNKDEIEIQFQTDITIKTNDVISNLKDYNDNNYFHLVEGEKLRVSTFIYGEDGAIKGKQEYLLNDYNEDLNISLKLPNGKYNLITISSVSYDNNNRNFWEYSGIDNINTFSLKQQRFDSDRAMLGLAEDIIVVDNEKTNSTINLKPATALVTVNFRYWVMSYLLHNYANENNIQNSYTDKYDNLYKFWYYAYNTYKKTDSAWEMSNDNLNIDYQYTYSHDVDAWIDYLTSNGATQYPLGTYYHFSLLPGSLDYNCTYNQLYKDGNLEKDLLFKNVGDGKMNIEKGKQYLLYIYCPTYTAEFSLYKENSDPEAVYKSKENFNNINLNIK